MKQCQGAVGTGVDHDGGLNKVAPLTLLGDLQTEPPIARAVVVGHDAALTNAQPLLQIAGKGNKGRSFLGGSDGELGIVLGTIDIAQIAVGRLRREIRSPWRLQFWSDMARRKGAAPRVFLCRAIPCPHFV